MAIANIGLKREKVLKRNSLSKSKETQEEQHLAIKRAVIFLRLISISSSIRPY